MRYLARMAGSSQSRRIPSNEPLVFNTGLRDGKDKAFRTVDRNISGQIVSGTINGGIYGGKRVPIQAPSALNKPRIPVSVPIPQAPTPAPSATPNTDKARLMAAGLDAAMPGMGVASMAGSTGVGAVRNGAQLANPTWSGTAQNAAAVNPAMGTALQGVSNAVQTAEAAKKVASMPVPTAAPSARAASLNGVQPGTLPTGASLGINERTGARSIAGQYGTGSARTDARPAVAGAGVYDETGKRFVGSQEQAQMAAAQKAAQPAPTAEPKGTVAPTRTQADGTIIAGNVPADYVSPPVPAMAGGDEEMKRRRAALNGPQPGA